MLNKSKK